MAIRMKNECNIIRDLLPLYIEDIASGDTADFVVEHLKNCADCRDELEKLKDPDGKITVSAEKDNAPLRAAMKKLKRRIEAFSAFLMIFGIFFGLGITNGGQTMFYNVIVMPLVGAFGYAIMRWRSLYNLPILLVCAECMNCLINFLRGDAAFLPIDEIAFLLLYLPFILLGIIIAALLHFALKKGEN